MADILYRYKERVYLNITNKCCCNCTFCLRNHQEQYGEAENLWFDKEPLMEEIIESIAAYDFGDCKEVVFCGFGEPTMELEKLLVVSRYMRSRYMFRIRLNTNGLSDLIYNRSTAQEICNAVDSISISLNMPDAESYTEVVRPVYGENAFEAMLQFAKDCKKYLNGNVRFSVVDVIGKENIEKCRLLAELLEIPLHIRAYS
ncbi:7-carboxy-7-deazaguanine synthase [Lachnospiraceae bacterium]|nr:7-carboxy-7-deazaguanine synthase [Lachnospiraceae bacterium]